MRGFIGPPNIGLCYKIKLISYYCTRLVLLPPHTQGRRPARDEALPLKTIRKRTFVDRSSRVVANNLRQPAAYLNWSIFRVVLIGLQDYLEEED